MDDDMLSYLVPGFVFTMLGTWWLITPIGNYYKSLRHKTFNYQSYCNYNVKGCPVPLEGVIKIAFGVTCVIMCFIRNNIYNTAFYHSLLYIGYITNGIIDIVNDKSNILAKGSGYVSLILAHLIEVLSLHFNQTQELRVKIKDLMEYNINETRLSDVVLETEAHYQYYHGLTSVENHSQFLLSLTILCACVSTIMEAKFRHILAFAVGRGIFGTLHGTWLWQMGLLTINQDKYDPVGDYSGFLNTAYAVHLVAVLNVTCLTILAYHCRIKRRNVVVLEPGVEVALNM